MRVHVPRPQPLTVPRPCDIPSHNQACPPVHRRRKQGRVPVNPDDGVPLEVVMAGTVRSDKPGRAARLNLNSDGQSHPLLNATSFFVLIVGLVSFALGLFLRTGPNGTHTWAVVASVTGLVGLLVGLVAQMLSATREERVIIVPGIIAAFVGLCLGLAHGGFS